MSVSEYTIALHMLITIRGKYGANSSLEFGLSRSRNSNVIRTHDKVYGSDDIYSVSVVNKH